MKTFNVYNWYDDTKGIIAKIRPNGNQISERTYKRLLDARVVGGNAGVYTDADFDIDVVDKYGAVIAYIRGVG